jgi:hypothetical protein
MSFILTTTTIMVLLTIATGIYFIYSDMEGDRKKIEENIES